MAQIILGVVDVEDMTPMVSSLRKIKKQLFSAISMKLLS
jgi:hypothetical protein